MIDPIRNASGTAYWIAQYRALESRSPRPLFQDPWAAELAGERGEAVMRALVGSQRFTWALAVRTVVFDELVSNGVTEQGFDTVVNLGAGLDTRAFRLSLPSSLRWFDVDTHEIIERKLDVLGREAPSCQYRALPADLSQEPARSAIFDHALSDARRALVITEGLLEYLTPEAVRQLARELHARSACTTWLCNLHLPFALHTRPQWLKALARAHAPLHFMPRKGSAFFQAEGWSESCWISLLERASELGRLPRELRVALALARALPRGLRSQVVRSVGVARLSRVDA